MRNGEWLQYASKKKLQARHDAKVRRYHRSPMGKILRPEETIEIEEKNSVTGETKKVKKALPPVLGKRTLPKGHTPCAECPQPEPQPDA